MSLPSLTRPQSLAPWQIESATPSQIHTDWYWTTVEMTRITDHIHALAERRAYDSVRAREINREIAGLPEEWETLSARRERLDQAYYHRRWTRAWLVTSSDGHIHSGPFCATYKSRTTCTLLPQASGWTQEQIVNAAGEKACTVCFPDAPVLPCTLLDPLTEQARAAKGAEKGAKR